jgi:hemoglobin
MKDITSKEDIQYMIDCFYDSILADDLLNPFFTNLNFQHHLPKMVDFWAFVLLDESGYTTDVTKKHLKMKIGKEHFNRWIELFKTTVNDLFVGPNAEKAIQRAHLIRWTIESKIDQSKTT